MRLLPPRPPAALRTALPGQRLLAWASLDDGWLVGTRSHLVQLSGAGVVVRLPWSEVQAADWQADEQVLVVTEVGEYGVQRRQHRFRLDQADRLLQLLRERVQASIVLQRHFVVRDGQGFRVVARRGPEGRLAWLVEYDEAVEPDSPGVSRIVDAALAQARADVGEEPI